MPPARIWSSECPIGTVIYEIVAGEAGSEMVEQPVVDLDRDGARFVLAKGGIGGKGNIHFATPWNQAPRTAEPGTLGEGRTVRLELKLLADVGLLGYPSVGKSTFISRVSRARPKIADYPFTTLVPNLGVVRLSGERTFVIADIPGLIEGASEGAGLGHQFLRHVERCRVLVHILEATFTTGPDRSPLEDFARDQPVSCHATLPSSPTSRRSSFSTRSMRSTRRISRRSGAS